MPESNLSGEIMSTRLTIDQLERMKTHELADLLANVVLLLRRLPDIECKHLIEQASSNGKVELPTIEQVAMPAVPLAREELTKKKVSELKALAKELHVVFSATIKKDDLIAKMLARSADGHSEQRAIQDL